MRAPPPEFCRSEGLLGLAAYGILSLRAALLAKMGDLICTLKTEGRARFVLGPISQAHPSEEPATSCVAAVGAIPTWAATAGVAHPGPSCEHSARGGQPKGKPACLTPRGRDVIQCAQAGVARGCESCIPGWRDEGSTPSTGSTGARFGMASAISLVVRGCWHAGADLPLTWPLGSAEATGDPATRAGLPGRALGNRLTTHMVDHSEELRSEKSAPGRCALYIEGVR